MNKTLMNIDQIMRCLPHRPPFLLVDRIIDMELGKSLVAIKNVTMNEPFFEGHFPGQSVMPGVLIVEALAQAAGVLAFKSTGEDPNKTLILFAGIDHARFKRVVIPGDQLRLEVNVLKARKMLWKVKAVATVDNEVACEAELISMKTEIA